MSLKRLFAVIAITSAFAQPALATVIVGAQTVLTTFGPIPGYTVNSPGLIDQAGLIPVSPASPKYVSGVTPYFDFLVGPPPKTHSAINSSTGFKGSGHQGQFDFTLTEAYALAHIAIWNGDGNSGINEFDVWVSADSTFASPSLVGTFNALAQSPPHGQNFDFDMTTQGAFVRMIVKSGHSGLNSIALGEVAFGALVKTVSEPASAALLGLGLLGFGFRRRSGHQR